MCVGVTCALWGWSVCSLSVCTTCAWCVDTSVHGLLLCTSTREWVEAGECSGLALQAQVLNQADVGLNPSSALSHGVSLVPELI